MTVKRVRLVCIKIGQRVELGINDKIDVIGIEIALEVDANLKQFRMRNFTETLKTRARLFKMRFRNGKEHDVSDHANLQSCERSSAIVQAATAHKQPHATGQARRWPAKGGK